MKLTPSEAKLLELMRAQGGSICPGADQNINREVHRIIRRLERRGLVRVEQTDDGERFTITGGEHAPA